MASIIDNGVEKGDMGHIYAVGFMMLAAAAIGLFADAEETQAFYIELCEMLNNLE